MLEEIHSHLIRSPPPITWHPLSPRGSAGAFSPDSGSDGAELDSSHQKIGSSQGGGIGIIRTISPPNIDEQIGRTETVNRSHSEEHILSPCQDLLKSEMFSPVRGATPEYLTPLNIEG